MTGPELAAAAQREVETRERRYPALVDAGKLDRAFAVADLAAWRRIAAWLETGQVPLGRAPELVRAIWTPLAEAAAEGLRRGDAACRKLPGDRATRERRDAVAEIHAMLARNAAAFEAPAGAEEAA